MDPLHPARPTPIRSSMLLLALALGAAAVPRARSGSELPAAPAPGAAPPVPALLGYIDRLTPESPGERAARHARVAERRRQSVYVLVHRGATRFAPENTLEAYAAAMDRGADGVEIDIRRSADGVLYLFHDDTLDRVTTASGPVRGRSYFELLRAGLAEPYGTAGPDTRIPTLAAILALARQRTALLHLDIKEPGLEEQIAALFDEADAWDHVVTINAGNAEQLLRRPGLVLEGYKGSIEEAGDLADPANVARFLERPARMIFCKADPTAALELLGRAATFEPQPLTPDLRARWDAGGACLDAPAAWRRLFNGRDLNGWSVKCRPADRERGFWRVDAGTILADSIGAEGHDYVWLITDEEFDDFDLFLQFQAYRDSPGNSGVQLRSRYDEEAGWLDGPQVDVHPPEPWRTGMVWDETRGSQRWLYPPVPKGAWVDASMAASGLRFVYADGPERWNTLELSTRGAHLRATLNGLGVMDYDGSGTLDDELHRQRRVGMRGHIALQIHSGDQLRIRYREIWIRPRAVEPGRERGAAPGPVRDHQADRGAEG